MFFNMKFCYKSYFVPGYRYILSVIFKFLSLPKLNNNYILTLLPKSAGPSAGFCVPTCNSYINPLCHFWILFNYYGILFPTNYYIFIIAHLFLSNTLSEHLHYKSFLHHHEAIYGGLIVWRVTVQAPESICVSSNPGCMDKLPKEK